MIVMSYVDGPTLTELLCGQQPNQQLSTILELVERAINLLHEAGLVFGDLRTPNIIVHDDASIKLVDFDWCGVDNVDKYPFTIDESIPWAEGVGPREIMRKDHDRYMLRQLKDKIRLGAKPDSW